MSLEAAVTDLTVAIKELIGVTTNLTNMRSEAIEKVGSALQNVASKTKDAKVKETKTKADEETKPDADDVKDGLKELVASYLAGTDREEERTARKQKIKKLLNHEKIKNPDVKDATGLDDIMDASLPLFRKQVTLLIEAGDITEEKSSGDDLDL